MADRLIFEPSWEKAIAKQDRKAIEQLHKASPLQKGKLTWTPIRAAMNHQGSLLAMVLIQNGKEETFRAEGIFLDYYENKRGKVASFRFYVPQVVVPPNSSMPWTFVFPKISLHQRPSLVQWEIQLSKYSYD
ncbi:SLAP domain-containing protein [Pseudalkalibacillus salsuginis]|uniref:SLAP domain-containing protein n=1 Tax=Pseudalkalibacillus salsuginis TaxID=2910972 RepID=UPI001F2243AA|nr:SLAP domain-containing protein [Pseudalkalibacillus salsuginis]MCF6410844.1 SLAP domain-containing protein [Pseudalkalibacillus salsuginis]